MAIVTHPANENYRFGFEEALGRRCLLCRKPIDRASAAEWEAEAHKACEEQRESSAPLLSEGDAP